VGDVLLKILEVSWKSIVGLLASAAVIGSLIAAWFTVLDPIFFPKAEEQLRIYAFYDDGTGVRPLLLSNFQTNDGKQFRCRSDYPIAVVIQNTSGSDIADISYDITGNLPGYTTNFLINADYISLGDKIIEGRRGVVTCRNVSTAPGADLRKLNLVAHTVSASFHDRANGH
jgi:hypothetical protein